MRKLTYAQAISEATVQCMAADPSVFVAGQNVDDEKGTHGTTREAFDAFGPSRVIDVPNSENAFAGIALGTAAAGMRPLVVHTRADFMFLAMDAVINLAAKWRYVYGDTAGVPVVMRGVVGRGWGQGATHSQSLQSVFGHFPGLRVAVPATPADAKGLLVSALRGRDPVVLLENRGLYSLEGEVSEEAVPVPFGKGRVARRGEDVTIVAASLMAHEAERAAGLLAEVGVSAEVLDPRSVRPLDSGLITSSVARTGRLVVADTSWAPYGFSAEVAAIVAESVPGALRSPVVRVTPPDCPAPVSRPLEEAFHPDAERIAHACLATLGQDGSTLQGLRPVTAGFSGPF
ncbi:pyruvate dehydrogenase E1 component beta subunit [Nocardiopsis arvandica]|uniref:Pyruvate dehydrogenase E1 component beta subunit n=1 Tax=Nocardiopsis sinuspersici TaxID=501010 RepID=A0A7Y9XHC3_9ACTN|nr:transketolase C-terminal domain-containing protein [Nocardiopsis sinuspersici]NYH55688.1 pyruvate dehydrogenase E1 component beta subunit [Nocardiopsis sinuspersici]